jgi:hypothetical protein
MVGTRTVAAAVFAVCSLLPAGAGAQSPASTDPGGLIDRLAGLTEDQSLSIGGVAYVHYWYMLDAAEDVRGTNSFELPRLYLTLKARMTDWLSMRVTTDAGPESSADTGAAEWEADPPPGEEYEHTHSQTIDRSYDVFVKFAYFEVSLPLDFSLQAGVIPSVWTGRLDDFWGFRSVAKEVSDEVADGQRLLYTADLGAQLAWKFPAGVGETVLAVVNGTGFRRAVDGDEYKTLQARLTFTPFASLCEAVRSIEVGGMVSYPINQEEPQNVFAAFLGYRHDWFRLGYQFLYQDNRRPHSAEPGLGHDEAGLGHAVYFRFQVPDWGVGVFGRFHVWDADVDDDADFRTMKLYAGLFYQPVRFLTLTATDAVTWQADGTDAEDPPTQNRLMLTGEFRF